MQEKKEQKFYQELKEHKQTLQACQSQEQLSSCTACPKILNCPTRTDYVKKVYLFLNKGQNDSDFDF